MARVESIIQHVEFVSGFDPDALVFGDRYGFVEDSRMTVDGVSRLLGFGVPIGRDGNFDGSDVVTPIVDFDELPVGHQTVDEQGKGVGPRMYNNRPSLAGAPEVPGEVGVYTFDIHTSRLYDGRERQGGKIARVAGHAGRIARAKVYGLESVVDGIHGSYGDVDGVLLEVPPHPEIRRAQRGVPNVPRLTPSFIIIRNADINLTRVGTTEF